MMESKIYDLLKADKRPRNLSEIAAELSEKELTVLHALKGMSEKGRIHITAVPLPALNDHSTYYTVW